MKKNKIDSHIHSTYSDGNTPPKGMVEAALEKGLHQINFTDHMPMPFSTRYAMDVDQLPNYRKEIQGLAKRFAPKIRITMGLEMEYLPQFHEWVQAIAEEDWETRLLSVHTLVKSPGNHCLINGTEAEFLTGLNALFNGDIKSMCRAYYKNIQSGIKTQLFQTLAHLDVFEKHNVHNRFFDSHAQWYQDLVMETLELAAENKMNMEINTAGMGHPIQRPYPAPWIITNAKEKGIQLILGSDAHAPESLGQYFNEGGIHDLTPDH